MPTPQERKALLFLSALALLGTAVRAARAIRAAPPPDHAAGAALRSQIAAVDSARARSGGRRQPRSARPRGGRSARAARGDGERGGSVSGRGGRRAKTSAVPGSSMAAPAVTVDLDRASASEIERLPYVGPVLARRIVADRDSAGPFGSLEGLQRVRGVGPALARKLAPNVTFSLAPRQSRVEEGGRPPPSARGRRARGLRPP